MAIRSLTLNEQIDAVAAGIKHIINTDHDCKQKGHCDFSLAMFGQIAGKVFEHNTLDELGKAYEGMTWCESAEKVING
jgi:hypothetical protein